MQASMIGLKILPFSKILKQNFHFEYLQKIHLEISLHM